MPVGVRQRTMDEGATADGAKEAIANQNREFSELQHSRVDTRGGWGRTCNYFNGKGEDIYSLVCMITICH